MSRINLAGLAATLVLASTSLLNAQAPVKVGFVYVGPVGDSGWTFQHDLARKQMEAALKGKVTTQFVENVPEGADSERVIREMAQSGTKVIFATSFGYMNPALKVAEQFPNTVFMHATGYKNSAEPRPVQRPLLRRPLPEWRHRRQDDQDQRRRLRGILPDPRSGDGHQRLHPRHAQRQSQGRSARGLGEFLGRPRQGA